MLDLDRPIRSISIHQHRPPRSPGHPRRPPTISTLSIWSSGTSDALMALWSTALQRSISGAHFFSNSSRLPRSRRSRRGRELGPWLHGGNWPHCCWLQDPSGLLVRVVAYRWLYILLFSSQLLLHLLPRPEKPPKNLRSSRPIWLWKSSSSIKHSTLMLASLLALSTFLPHCCWTFLWAGYRQKRKTLPPLIGIPKAKLSHFWGGQVQTNPWRPVLMMLSVVRFEQREQQKRERHKLYPSSHTSWRHLLIWRPTSCCWGGHIPPAGEKFGTVPPNLRVEAKNCNVEKHWPYIQYDSIKTVGGLQMSANGAGCGIYNFQFFQIPRTQRPVPNFQLETNFLIHLKISTISTPQQGRIWHIM